MFFLWRTGRNYPYNIYFYGELGEIIPELTPNTPSEQILFESQI